MSSAADSLPPPARAAFQPGQPVGAQVLLFVCGAQPLAAGPQPRHLLQEVLEESGFDVQVLWLDASAPAGLSGLKRWDAPLRPEALLIEVAGEQEAQAYALVQQLKVAFGSTPLAMVGGAGGAVQMAAALAAGVVDYLARPLRPREVLACLARLIQGARAQGLGAPQPQASAKQVLDAFGNASLVVQERDGRCVWHSSLARELMQQYFSGGHFERGRLPPELLLWLHREALRRRAGADSKSITVLPQAHAGATPKAPAVLALGPKRLSFALHAMDADSVGEGCWLIVLRESDDAALLHGLIHAFGLVAREAELLYWAAKGKDARELAAVLGGSAAEVQAGLQAMLIKLGVSTLDAALALAAERVKGLMGLRGLSHPADGF
ncbi:DNA-binding response OmpR family regulator/DNA-binding CsgD family transcriptional regulator [Paucibacter oligotrophus]|uniref:DNA-binding response OmpR family regulator/DNA-binding CsgD family transcriptional regulator n=1 Tax=Roseateles oligotrophus TaxID=1769250 RepID=A0A840LBS2_9BURK|nr:hypothetical protein [Roseateles oligotrophus]MBB4845181.1 DNA-binding response OmpR family regulator/DNA-binding CsgD family transcriptional regulator [Roseateles oligotrophus]